MANGVTILHDVHPDTSSDGAVRTVRRRHARYEAVDGRYAQVYVRVAVKWIMIKDGTSTIVVING